MNDISQFLSILNLFLLICSAIGGYFALRHARKVAIIAIQKDTIEALQAQIDALRDKQDEICKQNNHLEHIIITITEALKQRGILITISGDLVTLTDADGTHTIKRQPTGTLARVNNRPRRPSQQKKKEDV